MRQPQRNGRDSMRWRLMLSVLTYGAIVFATNLLGAQAVEPSSSLLEESRAAKFRMILGRLSLEPPKHIKCTRARESTDGLVKERLRVTACRGIPSLHYHWSTPTQTISVDVHLATHVKLRSTILIDE